jgi:CheY-like chemotaxis protein
MPSGKTVLICDDEAAIRRIVAAKLVSAGYTVREAVDGHQGLQMARESPPSVIVCDLQMPVMDGVAMCVQLRAMDSTRDIPVIMLTARGHMVPDEDIERAAISELIAKPFSARALLEIVNRVTGTSEGSARAAA